MGAVVLNRARETFTYAGVGNVEVRVLGASDPGAPHPLERHARRAPLAGARLAAPLAGGHHARASPPTASARRGTSAAYPGLAARSPQLLAGVLLRDFCRNSDDATVLVYR